MCEPFSSARAGGSIAAFLFRTLSFEPEAHQPLAELLSLTSEKEEEQMEVKLRHYKCRQELSSFPLLKKDIPLGTLQNFSGLKGYSADRPVDASPHRFRAE